MPGTVVVGRCVSKWIKISPKKVKIVADLIKRKPVLKAMRILKFTNKKAARIIEKTLKSAVDSFLQKVGDKSYPLDDVHISTVKVDRAMILKRYRPRFRGGANMIRKRYSHITIEVKGIKIGEEGQEKEGR